MAALVSRPYRIAVGVVGIVLGAGVIVWLVIRLRTFLVVLLVAGLIAAALDRPVNWVQRTLKLPRRGEAVAIVLVTGFFVLWGASYTVYKPISTQSASFRRDLPERVERVRDLPLIGPRLQNVDVGGAVDRFLTDLPQRLSRNRELLVGVAQTALNILLLLVTTITVSVFLLLKGPKIGDGAADLILDPIRAVRARRLARGVLDAVAGYVLGNLLISVCASLVVVISLAIMRVPFIGVLALVMFILDLLPLVGATLGGVIVTVATFLVDPHPWKALAFAAIFIVYQQVENHTLYPVIMGRTVKIGAFPVFLFTIAGTELAGITGALLAIPVGAALNVVAQDILVERRGRRLELQTAATPAGVATLNPSAPTVETGG